MQIENFDDLLAVLKSKTIQNTGDWEEDLIEALPEFEFMYYNTLASGLLVVTHRWYETSVTVIEVFNRFLGIRHVSNLFSESMGYSDCGVDLEFTEMKEISTVTYKTI